MSALLPHPVGIHGIGYGEGRDRVSVPRMPATCPSGCEGGRHTVQPGESMFSIAQQRRVSIDALIGCNPHITDPNMIFAGDLLCLPEGPRPGATLPCCLILVRTTPSVPVDALGTALVQRLTQISPGRTAITIAAYGLPAPSRLGDFDAFEGLAFIPGIISFRWRLINIPETFLVQVGAFAEITADLTANTVIEVRPLNTLTRVAGSPVLRNTLANCRS